MAGHLPPAPVPGRIRDLIHLKSIGEFAIIFLDSDITQFIIDKEGIIFTGGDSKINNDNTGITIDHEMTGIIAMKKAHPVKGAVISNVGPGKLAHV